MKILYAFLALILAATPALARVAATAHGKKDTGCTPSADPDVPLCGVKDEAPVYFPDKLAPTAKDKAAEKAAAATDKKGKNSKAADTPADAVTIPIVTPTIPDATGAPLPPPLPLPAIN